jgi:undecaprenyl-diphosphatase
VEILRAIVLGIVQGLTEFIPISSSAHLVVIPWLFGWSDQTLAGLAFDVSLHLGTMLAVLSFFARDWVRLAKAWWASVRERSIGPDADRRLAWFLVVGSIPGALIGLLAESHIEGLFHAPDQPIRGGAMIAMAIVVAILGGLLMLAEKLARHERATGQLRLRDSILVGLAQAAAVFPGVSRSGATITAGLALGLQRETAARFSFLLSAPIIAGAGMKSLVDLREVVQAGMLTPAELAMFPVGFVSAAISGYLCIKFLLRYLQRHSTVVFVYYRWGFAALIIAVVLLRG